MKPKGKRSGKRRIYRSPLRAERAAQTRERILEGLVRVMAKNGIAELSIPLIAREAGVSIPSVYRYFPTKRELVAALDEYAHRKGSFDFSEFPRLETPDDLANLIPTTFDRREAIEPTLSAAMSSGLGYAIRRPEFKQRTQYLANALRPATKNLKRKEAGWLVDIVLILNSHACVRAFKDYLGLNTQEAAKRVAWAIKTLARGTSTQNGQKRS
jgi:AcrR family transcriptional regulator